MKNMKKTIGLVMIILVIAASQGFGVIEYKDGGTHNIDFTSNDSIWVDYQAPSMQTTVNLFNEGTVSYPYNIYGFNNSIINIFGGYAGYSIYAYDNTQATMMGGSVDYYVATSNSHISMLGGTVNKSLYTYGDSKLTFSGGKIRDGYLFVRENSQAEMFGGKVAGFIEVGNTATLKIYGSNFAIDGVPFSYGNIGSILGGNYVDEPTRRLTGTLANGDIINNVFQVGDNASLILVPEPATLSLLLLGGIGLSRKYRINNI